MKLIVLARYLIQGTGGREINDMMGFGRRIYEVRAESLENLAERETALERLFR